MKIQIRILALASFLGASFLFHGCSKDKDAVKGAFQTGVLVVNEGAFSATNGDVTYYNASSNLLEQTIFKTANGDFAGKVLQSVTLDGDVGYLVLNAGNKIEIVDDNTFKSQHTFSDPKLINPRYLQVIDGKAYISVWGAFNSDFVLTDSYILVVDIKTLTVITTIPTDEGVENLLYNGKYLFATNYNYGASNTVAVIDPATNLQVKDIPVGDGPYGMVLDANSKLWVITTGSNGQLIRINTSTLALEESIDIGAFPFTDLAISPDKKTLIYSINNAIYKMDIDVVKAPSTAAIDISQVVALYALGADPKTGEIYVGDALDYSSAGNVYVYKSDNTLKTNFTVGIDPGQFIFR